MMGVAALDPSYGGYQGSDGAAAHFAARTMLAFHSDP